MRLGLELGLADYVRKNGFTDVVVGVSGGIDSAVTAALAMEALGAGARPLRLDAVALLVGRRRSPTRAGSPRTSGADFRELPIGPSSRRSTRRWPRRSRAASPT